MMSRVHKQGALVTNSGWGGRMTPSAIPLGLVLGIRFLRANLACEPLLLAQKDGSNKLATASQRKSKPP